MKAKRKNVPAGVAFSKSQGVSWPMRYVPTHKEKPAIDIANPLTLMGYISERNTKITALIDPAVKNMYARKQANKKMLVKPNASPFKK